MFYDILAQFKKSRKIGICPKGIVHGFVQTLEIFPSFVYFRETWHETFFSRYSREKRKTF